MAKVELCLVVELWYNDTGSRRKNLGKDWEVVVVARYAPRGADALRDAFTTQLAAMCFPWPDECRREYECQRSLWWSPSPTLLLTESEPSSFFDARHLVYTRRFGQPGPAGRYDVGSAAPRAVCCLTRHSDWSGCSDMLARVEGELMLGGSVQDVLERAVNDYVGPPKPPPRGWLGLAEVGALCRRLRSANEVRKLIGAVLCERRLIFYGTHEADVSRCVLGAAALPELAFGADALFWPHIVASMLTTDTIAYAGSPSPYLAGVHTAKLEAVLDECIDPYTREDVVLVNVDTGIVIALGTIGQSSLQHIASIPGDDAALGETLRRVARDVGAAVKHGDAARREARASRRREDRKRRELARRAAVEQLSASARKVANRALTTAKGRILRAAGKAQIVKPDDVILRDAPASFLDDDEEEEVAGALEDEEEDTAPLADAKKVIATPSTSTVETELALDDDLAERFFFDHYYEEESDNNDAAMAVGSLVAALIGSRVPQFVLPVEQHIALEQARELFVADRTSKSPALEPFARDFTATIMFASWALSDKKPPSRPSVDQEDEEKVDISETKDSDVAVALRLLAKGVASSVKSTPPTQRWSSSRRTSWLTSSTEIVTATKKVPEDDAALMPPKLSAALSDELYAALADFGERCRSVRSRPTLYAACELAAIQYGGQRAASRSALRRAAAIVMDDEQSRRRRKRPLHDSAERDARLGASVLLLAALLRGPPACLATVANEALRAIRRAAIRDADSQVRDLARLALGLCLDVGTSLIAARLRFDDLSAAARHPPPERFPPPSDIFAKPFPSLAALHRANAPRSDGFALNDMMLTLADERPTAEEDLLGLGDVKPLSFPIRQPVPFDSSSGSEVGPDSPKHVSSDPFAFADTLPSVDTKPNLLNWTPSPPLPDRAASTPEQVLQSPRPMPPPLPERSKSAERVARPPPPPLPVEPGKEGLVRPPPPPVPSAVRPPPPPLPPRR